MANKFQKSVQERLNEEEKRRKKQDISRESVCAISKQEPLESLVDTVSEIPADKGMDIGIEQKPVVDIREYLRYEPQRVAKNKTFYLDVQVIKAVKNMSKLQGITDSKLVNDILMRVLCLNGE